MRKTKAQTLTRLEGYSRVVLNAVTIRQQMAGERRPWNKVKGDEKMDISRGKHEKGYLPKESFPSLHRIGTRAGDEGKSDKSFP